MQKIRPILLWGALALSVSAFAPVKDQFTPAEQQSVSIETPGLFDRSDAFNIDFSLVRADEYSFPLPVGKVASQRNNVLEIATTEGDAVKAMFAGVVRLSRKHPELGPVIVVRHENGLETVYANNAQNLVKVGDHVKAGQTLAIVGARDDRFACDFSVMVNGARLNPETLIDVNSHRLRHQTLLCRKNGTRVDVTVQRPAEKAERKTEETLPSDPFAKGNTYQWNLEQMPKGSWAYPLPGCHVISPYGGKRGHGGVDLKTKPNDKILAAFDGVVTLSGPHYGYGNCIKIKHANGLETLYSHQSKNLVKVGQKVKAGEVIGLTGRTGRATTEHLHLETHFRGRRFNPNVIFDHANHALQRATLTFTKSGGVSSKRN